MTAAAPSTGVLYTGMWCEKRGGRVLVPAFGGLCITHVTATSFTVLLGYKPATGKEILPTLHETVRSLWKYPLRAKLPEFACAGQRDHHHVGRGYPPNRPHRAGSFAEFLRPVSGSCG